MRISHLVEDDDLRLRPIGSSCGDVLYIRLRQRIDLGGDALVHRFSPGDPVEDRTVDRLPAGQGAVGAAPRGLLGIRIGLEQAADPALRVVDRRQHGMITVNPIASAASLKSSVSFFMALAM